MPKGNPVVRKICVYLERESKASKRIQKTGLFYNEMSFGSFLLHNIGDERVSIPWVVINKTIIETVLNIP